MPAAWSFGTRPREVRMCRAEWVLKSGEPRDPSRHATPRANPTGFDSGRWQSRIDSTPGIRTRAEPRCLERGSAHPRLGTGTSSLWPSRPAQFDDSASTACSRDATGACAPGMSSGLHDPCASVRDLTACLYPCQRPKGPRALGKEWFHDPKPYEAAHARIGITCCQCPLLASSQVAWLSFSK